MWTQDRIDWNVGYYLGWGGHVERVCMNDAERAGWIEGNARYNRFDPFSLDD